ncbi:MAG: hypothetical protein ACM30I_10575 [Gemmatimonas sp.]
MRVPRMFLLPLAVAAAAALAGSAYAQQAQRIRGEVESVDGNVVAVKTPEGKTVKVRMDDNASVLHAAKASLSDIKPGAFVGTGALPDGDAWKAAEVHIFPQGSRQGEGHRTWSSNPAGTMTNAEVTAAAVSAANGKLTLTTNGQNYTINVPPEAPIVRFEKGSTALVKKGAWVEFSNSADKDGVLVAKNITVSDDRRYPVR